MAMAQRAILQQAAMAGAGLALLDADVGSAAIARFGLEEIDRITAAHLAGPARKALSRTEVVQSVGQALLIEPTVAATVRPAQRMHGRVATHARQQAR